MSKKNNLKDFLTDVAHAIKIKVPDVVTPINPQYFSNIVRSISGGGGEEEYDGKNTPLGVKPTSETWLLNETIDTTKSVNITSNISCTINLLIDNQGTYISKSGTTINVFGGAGGPYIIDVDSSGNRLVYYDPLGGWNSQYDSSYYKTNDTSKLRTITFAIPPTGELLMWLQANGTKDPQ